MDWRAPFDIFTLHDMCLLWRPALMSLHIIADGLIALAYFTIAFSILRFVRARHDLAGSQIAIASLFAAFIGLCGLTHFVGIFVLWVPIFIIEGWLKAVTAVVSVGTAGILVALVPQALKLPSVRAMQREIAAHEETTTALDAARAELAARVDRTEGELRVAEHDRHQSIAILRTVIEAVPGLIYAKNRSDRMLFANQAKLDVIGKPWPSVADKTDSEFLDDPRQAEILTANDHRIMTSGVTEVIEEFIDHPDKGPRVYLSTKVPFADPDDRVAGMVGLSIDITERSKAERELVHVARRAAMGDMAATIAHEINQPLAAIAFYLDGSRTLLARDGYEGPLREALTLALDQCLRAGEIIRRVRSFVSEGDHLRRPEPLVALIDEACGIALLGSRENSVTVSIEHGDADLQVLAEKVQIEQVIVNLVRNAIDATRETRGAAIEVTCTRTAGAMVLVSVRDNGPGISAEIAGRLFEPFVSTKGSTGMGFGLSISRTIIENHGGTIWADLDAEQGAVFRFSLPTLESTT